jgi:Protein of unknown function (DUF3108)
MPPPGALVNVLPERKAYAPGEVLSYAIDWSGIPAGRAVMSVVAGTDASGARVDRLISIMRSNKVVSLVYKVKDQVMSEIDPDTGVPRHITIDQRHGRRKRILEVFFDQADHKATTKQPGRETVTVDIPPNAQDIISCLYYLRSLDGIEPGVTKIVDVHEGRKNWRLLVRAEQRERVTVPAGTFDTVRVRAEVRFKGVFFDRGDVRLWLTDDVRHVPVRVSIKISIGQVLGELIGMALPPLPEPGAPTTREAVPVPMQPAP